MTLGRELAMAAGLPESAVRGYSMESWVLLRDGRSNETELAAIDEGLAYALRHGIEQTSLVPTRAYLHLNHAEWDEALASAELIASDSGWYDNALEIRARIAEGRDGPEAARPLYLEHAKAWRMVSDAPNANVPVSTAYAALLGGDRAGAEAALAELRSLGDVAVILAAYEGSRLVLCATLLNQPEWLDA